MQEVNYFLVFMAGIIAFLSPCILPVLPIYIGILSKEGNETNERVLIKHTLMFALGISTTFFLLAASISLLKDWFFDYKAWILIVGGGVIILMALFYMDVFEFKFLQKERRMHMKAGSMNSGSAYLLGFAFSFGWTPCIGPMLTSIMLMAASSETALTGNLLIALYSIGFMLPFVLISVFYKKLLDKLTWVKKHMKLIQTIGGIILLIVGIGMVRDGINQKRLMDAMPQVTQNKKDEPRAHETESTDRNDQDVTTEEEEEMVEEVVIAPDFTLVDQYGETHTLSEYKGKTVFLNFWATWCPPCKKEMPYIEALYHEYGENKEDVIILGVAMPNLGKEQSKEEIVKFLEKNNYTFPVVFDEGYEAIYSYGISAFPTTFMINPEGNVEGYIPGGLTKDMMIYLIENTRAK